jgi:Hg(II)-responsive transcriptional regulator
MKSLRIGEVARRIGCTVETIRLYEKKGLLTQPVRKPSGYRIYEEDDIARLRFIRKAKTLGFTLSEIKELLAMRPDPVRACSDVQRQAELKIADIDERMQALLRMKKVLVKLVKGCKGRTMTNQCPILKALDHWEGQ